MKNTLFDTEKIERRTLLYKKTLFSIMTGRQNLEARHYKALGGRKEAGVVSPMEHCNGGVYGLEAESDQREVLQLQRMVIDIYAGIGYGREEIEKKQRHLYIQLGKCSEDRQVQASLETSIAQFGEI